jgi:hypothetical protein
MPNNDREVVCKVVLTGPDIGKEGQPVFETQIGYESLIIGGFTGPRKPFHNSEIEAMFRSRA